MSKCYDNPEYDKIDDNLQNTWKQSKYVEPKQDLEKEMFELEQELDIPSSMRWHNSKPKQETLDDREKRAEELLKAYRSIFVDCSENYRAKRGFIEGANWQAQRMYSEEDMRKSFFQGWVTRERFDDQIPDIIYPQGLDYEEKQEYAFNIWFEQFKKK